MATIDQEGLKEVQNIKNALTHLYDKIQGAKIGKSTVNIDEEYSFIFKILGQMEDEWNHDINRVYTVPDELNINGKSYSSRS